jgi:hypothetical protein
MINPNTIGFASFQSHSQRCVRNQYGLFFTYWTKWYTDDEWDYVLEGSTDEGRTKTLIYTGKSWNEPPSLETDSSGNLYLFNNDTISTVKVYKYTASAGAPVLFASIAGLTAHKHTSCIDEANNRLYHYMLNVFTEINFTTGAIVSQTTILQDGPNAGAEYGHITCDPSGNVYLAYTTSVPNMNTGYIEWRWLVRRGGVWEKADGTNLTLPAVSDNTGSTEVIEAVEGVVSKWLSGWIYANEMLHAVGWTDQATPQQRYHTINPNTAALTNTDNFILGTASEAYADGAFIRSAPDGTAASPQPIYFVSVLDHKLTSVESTNNGVAWSGLEQSDQYLEDRHYSICPFREVYGGKVYGIYTNPSSKTPAQYFPQYSGFTYAFKLTI